jgi:hypothetical protein
VEDMIVVRVLKEFENTDNIAELFGCVVSLAVGWTEARGFVSGEIVLLLMMGTVQRISLGIRNLSATASIRTMGGAWYNCYERCDWNCTGLCDSDAHCTYHRDQPSAETFSWQ